ncbi:MAG TPA: YciI family protein [Actinomycetes bacterium]|nr:YciI family protein [Actinomycetes bacterium]
MARYMLLIYGNEADAPPTQDQWDWMLKAHGQFARTVTEQGGQILGGDALQPTATATSVRGDASGEQVVTDGPFVETKEALGGFYLIEAADLDQALAFAKLCPAPDGGVELRPIMDTSGSSPGA